VPKLYALALDLGVDQSTISRWTKDGGMSLDHAVALCSQLGISLDWLIFGRGEMEALGRDDVSALADMLETMEPELISSFSTIARAIVGPR
jgi:transcriptional regulator with XRE-family HTH domain